MTRFQLLGIALVAMAGLPGLTCAGDGEVPLAGLQGEVRVVTDSIGVPHIFARNDLDLLRVQGYVHARDRFWQMDTTRRQVDGTLAELLGASALDGDVQARGFGLAEAARRSVRALDEEESTAIQAYAEGVNAWLDRAESSGTLPPEYAALEITKVRRWSPQDTAAIGKAIGASLSLSIDVGLMESLEDYVSAGELADPPFDGIKMFFDDVHRFAPLDPAASIPDAGGAATFVTASASASAGGTSGVASIARQDLERTSAALRRFRDKAEKVPYLAAALDRKQFQPGSNHWGVAAEHSATGFPMIASDNHLALDFPGIFYEIHLVVSGDPVRGAMNTSGVSFPGTPAVVQGQNEHMAWASTVNPMDVTDIFEDTLVRNAPECSGQYCIVSGGEYHVVRLRFFDFLVNTPDDGVQDNLADSGRDFLDSIFPMVPFRSFGPVIDIEDPAVFLGSGPPSTKVLVVQYTGFHATREANSFRAWNRARSLDEFREALQFFDVGSQNWLYADADGTLAYFTSAELPLRADLEAGELVGLPPFFVRDGVSGLNNWIPDPDPAPGQAIPFEILPAEEMPKTINPAAGFIVSANNDPIGTTLDNDPLNQRRVSNPDAIYYLNASYADGLRAGRITQLLGDKIASGQKISVADMKRFQANTQQRDAELMIPFLLTAFAHAQRNGAPGPLAALAADARIQEAISRLEAWDFSTPTGIPEGWDAHDSHGLRTSSVFDREARASVAATLYNVWRAKAIRTIVDARLAEVGLPRPSSGDALKALHHLLTRVPFTGIGASGLDFFNEPETLAAEDQRDVALLSALADALDSLASERYAAAFGGSTDQDDYRWGKLHRKTFDHLLGGEFSAPPAGGFEDLAPDLPGIPRDGGYQVVNLSGFSARADNANAFRFNGGPARRYVGVAGGGAFRGARVAGFNVMPGGSSGDPGNPLAFSQLPAWLTADYHAVGMFESDALRGATRVEAFVPGLAQ